MFLLHMRILTAVWTRHLSARKNCPAALVFSCGPISCLCTPQKPRLLQLGLEACETVADGSCQFLSVCFTAGIPVDPADFQSQCVNYLRHLPHLFTEKINAKFASFEAYLQNMSRPSTWGDELTLQAAACLLLTCIRVLSDYTKVNQNVVSLHPLLLPKKFGEKNVTCHIGNNHFEATAPLAEGQKDVKVEPKRIKIER